ncbi:MAG: hypothetical protein LBQ65_06345 [Tannerellaceae bacterium]|jgi:hypothetical protein|nr:hypothetical protein [Tannerellaceae bacterium]
MRDYLKEIIISIAAILFMAVAIVAYLKAVKEEKANSLTDIYTLIPPNANALLAVNRPAVFTQMILNEPSLYRIFAAEIPDIFLSIIRENQEMSLIVFSFHPQGVICYMQAGSKTTQTIAKEILPKKFKPYSPQVRTDKGIAFHYYPDAENHFFGSYVHNGIWVGSYSSKLLERAALQHLNAEVMLPAEMDSLRKTFDANAPLNIICPTTDLGIHRLQWLSADLFISKGNFCCYGSLPYDSVDTSLYMSIGDTLAQRIEAKYPRIRLSFQVQREGESLNLTGCSPM